MTSPRRDGKEQTPFSEWVRNNPRLDSRKFGVANQDIDWIWHQWLASCDTIGDRTINHILLIEEKSHGADLSPSERDVMFLIDQVLRKTTTQRLTTLRGDRVNVRIWGYFKLRYSGETILSSNTVWWNKRIITVDQLEEILRFEVDPRTMQPRSDRRHHTPPPQPLFDRQG